jgi:hypothetical protein
MKRQSSSVTQPLSHPVVVPFRVSPMNGSLPPAARKASVSDDADVEPDDFALPEDHKTYRDRMLVNLAALGLLALLIAAGLWLADAMATLRQNEDCVLSGRHDCTPLDYSTRK